MFQSLWVRNCAKCFAQEIPWNPHVTMRQVLVTLTDEALGITVIKVFAQSPTSNKTCPKLGPSPSPICPNAASGRACRCSGQTKGMPSTEVWLKPASSPHSPEALSPRLYFSASPTSVRVLTSWGAAFALPLDLSLIPFY